MTSKASQPARQPPSSQSQPQSRPPVATPTSTSTSSSTHSLSRKSSGVNDTTTAGTTSSKLQSGSPITSPRNATSNSITQQSHHQQQPSGAAPSSYSSLSAYTSISSSASKSSTPSHATLTQRKPSSDQPPDFERQTRQEDGKAASSEHELKRDEDNITSTSSSPSSSIIDRTHVDENTHIPVFSTKLHSSISAVYPSSASASTSDGNIVSALDEATFDPIQYINNNFPDEASLFHYDNTITSTTSSNTSGNSNKLDKYLSSLRSEVVRINDSITHDIRHHAVQRVSTATAIQNAYTTMNELYKRIQDIEHKASDSEQMVTNITRDIKSLDHAKRHLNTTITALRNLHMLQSAMTQLDIVLLNREYHEASKLFKAINDLFTLFHSYQNVPKIKALRQTVYTTKQQVKDQLFLELKRVLMSPNINTPPTEEEVQAQCMVVDVLDDDTTAQPVIRNELLDWWCGEQLSDYIQLFGSAGSGATFDLIERRYAWLRRCWGLYKERYTNIFPSHWSALLVLTETFCRVTKSHISKLLQNSKPETSVMIKALQKTIEFEKEMTVKFSTHIDIQRLDLNDEVAKEHAVKQIKEKYKLVDGGTTDGSADASDSSKPKQGTIAAESGNTSSNESGGNVDFSGSISSVFTPYMSSYVDMERNDIHELLLKIDREEQWSSVGVSYHNLPIDADDRSTQSMASQKNRYTGADDLFLYIKNSIQRCCKLSKNTTFYSLYMEYQRGLQQYSDILESHLPATAQQQQQLIQQQQPSSLDVYNTVPLLTTLDIMQICYIMNTAQYCVDTVTALEETISRLIDEEYADKISFSDTSDKYSVLINKCIQALVCNITIKVQRALAAMTRMSWDTWTSVGDESNYIKHVDAILRDDLPSISSRIHQRYHSAFCNSIASSIIPRYIDTIFRCKKLNDIGAQQMSLDAQVLKRILLNIPDIVAGKEVSTIPSATTQQTGDDVSSTAGASSSKLAKEKKVNLANKLYAKYVNAEMSKAEALLKTLVSPSDRLIVTFKALLPKASMDDLVRVMNLRGLKRVEQQTLVNAYNNSIQNTDDAIRLPSNIGVTAFTSTFGGLSDISSFIKIGAKR